MATTPHVVVFDYGSGNVHSAVKALERAGASVSLSAHREDAMNADGLVVPGVGAFASVMEALGKKRGGEIIERRLAGGRPVLGICVGLQIMFDRGVEHGVDTPGLAQWPGVVEKLDAPRLPHMGWNTVDAASGSDLFAGVEHERFYFVHSYGVTQWSLEPGPQFVAPKVSWSEHGQRFVAAVENGPLSATQFHPEKSGDAGIQLLTNWLGRL
ncbi:imidazole glycerol phosphate synthase glutamine amidotransferase subunit [Pontimonas salivibrio]|uniref:Imidazole glycerol phosphate synthase subunit HisH n=1 Tax=Pontimonas salivibrio TaxID=1159327 RepID=A0A2L2BR76_9MICO|nr:imidazole glycerol phosphate synthase subunit HisH [Pontimonas salivibrio]AVG24169.1 imidazole glycerol phosphate synthase glutamine amidotransferase subunit [Pontimonas salivibrio]